VSGNNRRSLGETPIPYEDAAPNLDEQAQMVLSAVYQKYRSFSAWGLVAKTHKESPWRNAGNSDVITNESILKYFEDEVFSTAFQSIPVAAKLPQEWYDPAEDAEWEAYL
jgi:hypothetical protein